MCCVMEMGELLCLTCATIDGASWKGREEKGAREVARTRACVRHEERIRGSCCVMNEDARLDFI